ncbi:MAG: hypothetical protein RL660_3034 [Bacteroidota bacterium]|jgi:hypothetical protein
MLKQNNYTKTFTNFTALWAVVESGFGGVLHAFNLPFTGIVLGGFSVLIVRCLALHTNHVFRDIVAATLIVAAIKALANPITSPFAYIALGFQGILGAIIYSINRTNFLSHIVYAPIAIVESAVQKLLMMTLFFGATFWKGVEAISIAVNKALGIENANHYSLLFVNIGIYLTWGIVLAFWLHALPKQIAAREVQYRALLASLPVNSDEAEQRKSKPLLSRKKLLALVAIGLLLAYLVPSGGQIANAFLFLLRTLLIVALWYLLVVPIFSRFAQKRALQTANSNSQYGVVVGALPRYRQILKLVQHHVNTQYKGYRRIKEFVIGMLTIAMIDDAA